MNTLKILSEDDNHAIIGGYGVVFGGQDLVGETFTAETDYMLDLVPVKPVFIDHSEGSTLVVDGKAIKLGAIDDPVGRVLEVTPDDIGLYMKLQLDKSNRYWGIVERMLATGKAGLSSSTISNLSRRKGNVITRWPIVEESITLTPAEPRTVGVERLKHVTGLNPELKALTPEAAGTAAEDEADEGESPAAVGAVASTIEVLNSEITESEDMSGENQTQAAADPRDVEIKALSDRVNQLIEVMEKSPALKSAGYTTDDGGAADASHKSFGDWLLAVKRNDTKRLKSVYGSTKDMEESTGASGGFLVRPEHMTPLLKLAGESSPVYQRVQKVPVKSDSGDWPALDQYVAPTAGVGNTALAGGITAATTAERGTLTETQPGFTEIQWRIHKVGGFTEVSNELIADSPESIEALLTMLFGVAIGAKNERNILRGSGAGEPLGILNAACTIGVTTATNDVFAYADSLAMRARFKSVGGAPVWIIHPGIQTDLGEFLAVGGVTLASQMVYPIIQSEHMPAPNTDDVILADLSAYLFFERQALSIAYSEHAAFTTDKGTWRFTSRNDGQPWLKNVITLADPGGSYTVSPFVYHND